MKIELLILLILLINITIILIAIIFINATKKKEKKKRISVEPPPTIPSNTNSFNLPKREEVAPNTLNKPKINYKDIYEPKWLLTYNEKNAFKIIYNVVLDRGYYVFTKVRLLDLIQPRKYLNQKYL